MRSRFRNLAGIGALAALLVATLGAWFLLLHDARMPVTILREQVILVAGVPRTYRLVIPDSVEDSSPVPLLVALHGAIDTVEQAAEYMDLDRLAAEKGCCVLYLQGTNLSWPPFIPAEHPEVVDREVAFFDAACDEIAARYPIDRNRVYVTGMSQGAAFLHILVARRSQRIAAAASHSGWLPDPLGKAGVHTENPCPMPFIAGADDRQVSPDSVEEARQCFDAAGHPTEWIEFPGLGYCWAKDRGVNETIWRFLSKHHVPP